MPNLVVEVAQTYADRKARPSDALQNHQDEWLRALLGAMRVLLDLNGRQAGMEALNPFFIDYEGAEEDVVERGPVELWALLDQIEHWRDRFPGSEHLNMVDGRQWFGVLPFSRFKLDVIILAAEPSLDSLLIVLLEAVPEGKGEEALENWVENSEDSSFFDDFVAAAR